MKIIHPKFTVFLLLFWTIYQNANGQTLAKYKGLRFSVGLDSTMKILGQEIADFDYRQPELSQIKKMTDYLDVLQFFKVENEKILNEDNIDKYSKSERKIFRHVTFERYYNRWFFVLHWLRLESKYSSEDFYGVISDFNKVKESRDNEKYPDAAFTTACAYLKLGNIQSGCNLLSEAGQRGSTKAYDLIQKVCK